MANIINLIAFAISIAGLAGAVYIFYTTLKKVTKGLKK
nr:MAG TPA: hypothetical protein [Caudoviricetes sp.]